MGEMAEEAYLDEMIFVNDYECRVQECFDGGYWPSQEGIVKISEMTETHIRNAIRYMERNPDKVIADMGGIKILSKELERRARNGRT